MGRMNQGEGENLDLISIEPEVPLPEKKKEPKWKKAFSLAWRALVVAFFVVAILYSGEIIWLYSAYTPFYVVGDSMYPTLNSDATRSTGGKEDHDGDWGNYSFASAEWYRIDFGFMETDDFIDGLERFDIVVTHFPTDGDSDGYKIKRIVGLPGETIYFDDEGELYVKKEGESDFEYIAQDSFEIRNQDSTNTGSDYADGLENAYTVPEDCYFLVGDNRTASTDSRSVGAIESSYFRGKAVYIVGTCLYTPEVASGEASPTVNWLSFLAPWNFQKL